MFIMSDFIKTNLINGYWDGSFTETQVNIFAANYLMNGMILQEDFEYILDAIKPQESEVEGVI